MLEPIRIAVLDTETTGLSARTDRVVEIAALALDVDPSGRFIVRAKALGFTLQEIADLLDLRAAPGAGCADVQARAEAKIADIEERIAQLDAMKRALCELVAQCRGEGPLSECPILDALDEETP
jgi:hypothetical protein